MRDLTDQNGMCMLPARYLGCATGVLPWPWPCCRHKCVRNHLFMFSLLTSTVLTMAFHSERTVTAPRYVGVFASLSPSRLVSFLHSKTLARLPSGGTESFS